MRVEMVPPAIPDTMCGTCWDKLKPLLGLGFPSGGLLFGSAFSEAPADFILLYGAN